MSSATAFNSARVVTLRVYGIQTARPYVALIVLSIAVWLGVRQCR
jgi:hypothetical protein